MNRLSLAGFDRLRRNLVEGMARARYPGFQPLMLPLQHLPGKPVGNVVIVVEDGVEPGLHLAAREPAEVIRELERLFLPVLEKHLSAHAGSAHGKEFSADLDKASEENERNSFIIVTGAGQRVGVVQIAGLVARRIVCFTGEGDGLGAGQRIGMIRFGSRVDVYLPEGTRVFAGEGQIATAGETLIADLAGRAGELAFQRG